MTEPGVASKGAVPRTDEEMLDYLKALARTELELRPEQVANLRPDTLILEGLQLDSLKQVVLLTHVEETFGIELSLDDRDELQNLTTVADLIRFIRTRAGGRP